MKKPIILISFIFFVKILFAQTPTQTIKGIVIDQDTKEPLIGATLTIEGFENLGTTTDIDGRYRLENIPVGRNKIQVTYIGYVSYINENILLNSAKELELQIELTPTSEELGEVVVVANQGKNPNNVDLLVSAISFSVDDIKSNAASANDPGSCLLYTSPSPRDRTRSRMPSSA